MPFFMAPTTNLNYKKNLRKVVFKEVALNFLAELKKAGELTKKIALQVWYLKTLDLDC